MSFKEYFLSRPDLRYILFSGKGGVGKTTLSAATAYWLSRTGKRVVVFSTDPQGSLSDIFERNIFGMGECEIMPNLFAMETDPDKKVSEYQEQLLAKAQEMYGEIEIPGEIRGSIEAMAAEPSVTLSTTFDTMVQLMNSGKDYYVFDMMPHGHALRFLGLADLMSKWIDQMVVATDGREESDKRSLSEELDSFKARLAFLDAMMKDEKHMAFFYVLVPEITTILDTKKALDKFAHFGIPLSGILVNMVYPSALLEQHNIPQYLRNRIVKQQENMQIIKREFGGHILGTVHMLESEPKGIEMISRIVRMLFADDGVEKHVF